MNESESILILAERKSLPKTSCLARRRALVDFHVDVFEDHVIEGLSGGNERKARRPSDADVEEDWLVGVVKEELPHLFFNFVFALGFYTSNAKGRSQGRVVGVLVSDGKLSVGVEKTLPVFYHHLRFKLH